MKQKNTLFTIAGYLFVLYSLIEIIDCITATLMYFEIVGNIYPEIYFAPMSRIFNENPGFLIPLFTGITGLRVIAALGLLLNKSWKIQIALASISVTFILVPFMLPFSVVDFLICSILTALILIGNQKK